MPDKVVFIAHQHAPHRLSFVRRDTHEQLEALRARLKAVPITLIVHEDHQVHVVQQLRHHIAEYLVSRDVAHEQLDDSIRALDRDGCHDDVHTARKLVVFREQLTLALKHLRQCRLTHSATT